MEALAGLILAAGVRRSYLSIQYDRAHDQHAGGNGKPPSGFLPHLAVSQIPDFAHFAQLDLAKTAAEMNVPGWGVACLGRQSCWPVCGAGERELATDLL